MSLQAIYDRPDVLLDADDASRAVVANYERSRDRLVQDKISEWREQYRGWRAIMDIEDDSIMSQLPIPLIFSHIESFVPRAVSNRPRIEVWGRGDEDKALASVHRNLIFYDWDVMNMPLFLVDYDKSALIYGTAIGKCLYKRETRKRVVKQQVSRPVYDDSGFLIDREIFTVEDVQDELFWDDPFVEMVNLKNFYPDPDGWSLDSCAWVIEREIVDLNHLENAIGLNGKLYKQDVVRAIRARLKLGNKLDKFDDVEDIADRSVLSEDMVDSQEEADVQKRQCTLLTQWTDNKITAVVKEWPDIPPVRNEYHDFGMKPFFRYTPTPDPKAFYGVSMSEMLYTMFLEMSTLHAARMDHVLQSSHAMMSVLRGTGVNPKNLRWRPGGYYYTNSQEAVQFMQPPPLDLSTYRESDFLRLIAQDTSGGTDTFRGLNTGGSDTTATEAQIMAQASGTRAQLMFNILSWQALSRLGRLLIRINETHITDEKKIRILGIQDPQAAQFLRVQPQDLARRGGIFLDAKIDIAATEPATRQFMLQQGIQAAQILGPILGNHPAMQAIIMKIMEGLGVDNPEMLAQAPIVPPAAQEQQAAAGGGVTPGEQLAAASPAAQVGGPIG